MAAENETLNNSNLTNPVVLVILEANIFNVLVKTGEKM